MGADALPLIPFFGTLEDRFSQGAGVEEKARASKEFGEKAEHGRGTSEVGAEDGEELDADFGEDFSGEKCRGLRARVELVQAGKGGGDRGGVHGGSFHGSRSPQVQL